MTYPITIVEVYGDNISMLMPFKSRQSMLWIRPIPIGEIQLSGVMKVRIITR
jgi:cytochrome c-type biogenesis protein CcmH/NrfF